MRRVVLLSVAALATASGPANAKTILSDFGVAAMDQTSGDSRGPDVGFGENLTGAFQWQNHRTFDWSLSYDGTNLTFNWGGTVVSKEVDLTGFKTVGFQGFTINQGQETLPQDLKLTVDIGEIGGIDPVPLIAEFDEGFSTFFLHGVHFGTRTWTIDGTAVADWTGPLGPNTPGFGFAFGIAAELESVPEPAALGLFGLGALGLGIARRRRRA